MCGILGLISYQSNIPDIKKFESSLNLMRHRGPDDCGIEYFQGMPSVLLGHRRLSIIDLTAAARQPISDYNKLVYLVYNGEIYNYKEIRAELKRYGYRFNTKSDSEVIVYAYIHWGSKFVERLNGIFAFALWDMRTSELLLVRDRSGVKPLYYFKNNDLFIFASEIKSILEYVEAELDSESLSEYVTLGYVPWPHTLFKRILKVPPASILRLNHHKTEIKRYWEISRNQISIDFNEAKLELRRLMEASVKSQMMSDVPVGTFLSGGIDSSVITYLASKNMQNLKSYTMGFNESKFDESIKAAEFSKWLSIEQKISFCPPDKILNRLPELIWHLDEPIAEALIYPINILSKEAKKDFTVALSGEGADEYFYGYKYYLLTNIRPFFPKSGFLANYLKGSSNPKTRAVSLLLSDTRMKAFENWSHLISGKEIKTLLSQDGDAITAQMELRIYNSLEKNDLNYFTTLDQNYRLTDYILSTRDKMSMAEGLELRVPFLDHQILEFVSSIPDKYKLKFRTGKVLLRSSFEGILPNDTIKMHKKPFSAPIVSWLSMLGPTYLKNPTLIQNGILKKEGIARMLLKKNYPQLWMLLVLEIWYRIFITKELKIH